MVKLVSYLPNGRARIVRLHCRGQVLGLEGLLQRPFEHSAIAVGELEVEHVPLGRLRRLQHEDPVALNGLLFQWHDALAQADKWIADFSTGEIKPRVARLLQYLSTFDCGPATGTFGLLTVEELAEILGATPESVSRHLAAFKRQDILHREAGAPRKIYRLDVERVQREAIE
jgi:CRP/FNR family transcriptional regulator